MERDGTINMDLLVGLPLKVLEGAITQGLCHS